MAEFGALVANGAAPAEHGLTPRDPRPPTREPSAFRLRDSPSPKTRPRRDKRHLEYVASKPCLVCAGERHRTHIICAMPNRAPLGARSVTNSPYRCARIHHRQLHDRGDERAWWAEIKINPAPMAQQLWKETRG